MLPNFLRLKKKFEPELSNVLDKGQLLIISPFNEQTTRVTKETAFIRNCLILQLTDEIYIPYLHPGGMLEKLLNEFGVDKISKIDYKNSGRRKK
jgi:hypothetical protein